MVFARNMSRSGVTALLLLIMAVPYMMMMMSVRYVEAARPGVTNIDAKIDQVRKAFAPVAFVDARDYICADECKLRLEGQHEFVPDNTSPRPKSPPTQAAAAGTTTAAGHPFNHFH
ncbi:hypothetical protein GOP47_0016618 [Adiantum capillus-veneris]|uniref:Transmembrane protein n=1 Tax=Adiantum capillus-veneris TaxID=13818 RepID=A0A9D4ZAG6_ADICA|nr:hypothetical protein GOP47_0016618 [Adiantum capillus-veneris]